MIICNAWSIHLSVVGVVTLVVGHESMLDDDVRADVDGWDM